MLFNIYNVHHQASKPSPSLFLRCLLQNILDCSVKNSYLPIGLRVILGSDSLGDTILFQEVFKVFFDKMRSPITEESLGHAKSWKYDFHEKINYNLSVTILGW